MLSKIVATATVVLTIAIASIGCERTFRQHEAAKIDPTAKLDMPASLNEVMVAMVNNAADPIWQAAWRRPETDDTWRALERNAYQLEIAGALLTVPGTGPLDKDWTANPQWIFYSGRLKEAGRNARTAIIDRDIDAIKLAGDRLVEVCEGCHIALKPAEPTGGKFGELSPTGADFNDL